jgi:tetratricopeptide (TPR) repeat protein/transcriptional regulator with XRE-family HTH domain
VVEGGVPGGPLSSLLRRYREQACLTQEEVARRSGLSVRALSDMERGRTARPLVRSVRLLADALELDPQARAGLVAAARGVTGLADSRKPEDSDPGQQPSPLVPRQLPAPVPHFAGRSTELHHLSSLLAPAAADGVENADGAENIAAVAGTAGVGKTTLAVHWAHMVADRFPDGQLYINLGGFDPAASPTTPDEAIRRFLDALGVPPGQIPASLDAQAALYRSMLSDRSMLVILDDARDEQQVRPLLPGGGRNVVVVTSRNQLSGLVAIEGACHMELDVLSTAEAWQLLAGRLGAPRLAVEPRAAAELIGLCACLPLALAVATARAAIRPGVLLSTLVTELRDTQSRLDALDDSDQAASVRAVFCESYENLQAPTARMFRLLALHPGPDISAEAAASLTACTLPETRRLLHELTRCHLLSEPSNGRFTFHDLLRAFAAEQVSLTEAKDARAIALARMLDYYLHAAHQAALLLSPSRDAVTLNPRRAGALPKQLGTYEDAMAWFATEHHVLLAITDLAAASGLDTHAWQLPWALEAFLDGQGHWRDLEVTQRTALAAAQRLGDLAGQAHMHRNIGHARFWHAHLFQALALYRQLGDRVSQARVHVDLARVLDRPDGYREGLGHSREALHLFREVGNQEGEARALNAVGWNHAHLGDQQRALGCCQQALALAEGTSDRIVVASTCDSLGYVHHNLGEHANAIRCYRRAISLWRDLGNLHNQAETLTRLGDVWHSSGGHDAARKSWQQALAILDSLGHHDAEQVRAKLGGVTTARLASTQTGPIGVMRTAAGWWSATVITSHVRC